MASNTKLSAHSKAIMKNGFANLKDNYNYDIFINPDNGITVLVVEPFPNSRVMWVSTSIMSPTEKKFRKSVGKYFVLSNFENGKYIDVPRNMVSEVVASFTY